jgi:hypothetical protein
LEGASFFAIREVHSGRAIDVAVDSGNAWRYMPDAHQFLSLRIRERLDQDGIDHAEDSAIGSDPERQRYECNSGEHGRKR